MSAEAIFASLRPGEICFGDTLEQRSRASGKYSLQNQALCCKQECKVAPGEGEEEEEEERGTYLRAPIATPPVAIRVSIRPTDPVSTVRYVPRRGDIRPGSRYFLKTRLCRREKAPAAYAPPFFRGAPKVGQFSKNSSAISRLAKLPFLCVFRRILARKKY